MAALTWRNVDAPDFGRALEGVQQFNQMLGQAFSTAKQGINEFDAEKSKQVNAALQLQLASATTPEEVKAIQAQLASNPDARRLSAETLGQVGSRATNILNQQQLALGIKGETANQEWAGTTRGRQVTQWAATDAVRPVLAQIAAARGDQDAIQKIYAQNQNLLGNITPEELMRVSEFGTKQITDDLGIQSSRLGIKQGEQNYVFGAENQGWSRDDRMEGKAAQAIAQIVAEASGGDLEAARSNFINATRGMPPTIRSAAGAALSGQYGNIFGLDTSGGGVGGLSAPISTEGLYGNTGWKITDEPGSARPGGRKHAGWDLSGMSVGTPVAAPMGGKVTVVKANNGNAGNMVTVQYSNGKTNTFMHLDSIDVKPGQTFEAGSVLGKAGNTGNASTKGTNRAVLHVEGTAGLTRATNTQIAIGTRQRQANGFNGQDVLDSLDNNQTLGEVVADLQTAPEFKGIDTKYIAGEIRKIKRATMVDGKGGATDAQAAQILRRNMQEATPGFLDNFRFGGSPNLKTGFRVDDIALEGDIKDFRNQVPFKQADQFQRGAEAQAELLKVTAMAEQAANRYSTLASRAANGEPIPAGQLAAAKARAESLANSMKMMSALAEPLAPTGTRNKANPAKRTGRAAEPVSVSTMLSDVLSGSLFKFK